MKVGSLFSGIGGIEIGFERQGFKTEWFIESEQYCKEIIKKRFPQAKIYGDIKKVDFRTVPKVDILTGGFPCQDISNAGKRAGIEGSRSSLWKYYCEAIRILQPEIAFIENVSALLDRGLHVVLADLASLGYDAEWYCVSASSIGANHQRDRIFILAYPINNTDRTNGREKSEEERLQGFNRKARCPRMFSGTSKEVSDTYSKGLEREYKKEQGSWESKEAFGWGSRWDVEPELGRVANGIPNRVDRIKCIGNAVVPQVAEVFARAIKEESK